jgi:hypothetical protein
MTVSYHSMDGVDTSQCLYLQRALKHRKTQMYIHALDHAATRTDKKIIHYITLIMIFPVSESCNSISEFDAN